MVCEATYDPSTLTQYVSKIPETHNVREGFVLVHIMMN